MAFEYKGATISAREMTIGDADDAALLALVAAGETNKLRGFHVTFAEFQIGADIEGDPPIPMVAADDPPEMVEAAYRAWRKLPRSFAENFRKELEAVEGKKS